MANQFTKNKELPASTRKATDESESTTERDKSQTKPNALWSSRENWPSWCPVKELKALARGLIVC